MYSLHDLKQDPEAFTWDVLCLYYLAYIGDKEAIEQTDIINKILFEELDIEGWVVHGNREMHMPTGMCCESRESFAEFCGGHIRK